MHIPRNSLPIVFLRGDEVAAKAAEILKGLDIEARELPLGETAPPMSIVMFTAIGGRFPEGKAVRSGTKFAGEELFTGWGIVIPPRLRGAMWTVAFSRGAPSSKSFSDFLHGLAARQKPREKSPSVGKRPYHRRAGDSSRRRSERGLYPNYS